MYVLVYLARGGNAVVDHWHHHSKIEGSSPAAVGTGREKWQKNVFGEMSHCGDLLRARRRDCIIAADILVCLLDLNLKQSKLTRLNF
jgi:hypothetical protein